MFEFSVASKYLIPRRRQLSVSIISLISVLVIALVVWLVVVFFSVTDGLEKGWVQKLTALTAPVRVTPTDAYYQSHYYQIDSISEKSGYSYKTIREKQESIVTDPHEAEYDEEPPAHWAYPDLDVQGKLKDLVQLAYASIDEIKGVPGIRGTDFELTASQIHLGLQRESALFQPSGFQGRKIQSSITYPTYLGNFDSHNEQTEKILLKASPADITNFLSLISYVPHPGIDPAVNEPNQSKMVPLLSEKLTHFFKSIEIQHLKPRPYGWIIPPSLLPIEGYWDCCVVLKGDEVSRVVVTDSWALNFELKKLLEDQNLKVKVGRISFLGTGYQLDYEGQPHLKPFPPYTPIIYMGKKGLVARLETDSIEKITKIDQLRFNVEGNIQGLLLKGMTAYRGLEVGSFVVLDQANLPWVHKEHGQYLLPKGELYGEGILLPKSFRDVGVLLGDRGTLSYYAPTISILQEHLVPIYVAGFYDPGIIPIGQKYILTNRELTTLIRSSHQQDDKTATTNGINIRFDKLNQADLVKAKLLDLFSQKGIARYWKVETYKEYEFTKEIIQELQSQKNLFMLIAIVIIVVACSNIISMLIILVNDKKVEIGILRSMGASSRSIALIFGLAGSAIGIGGSVIGIALAVFTLNHLNHLIELLSRLQGHDLLSSHLYGEIIPNQLSYEALLFVLISTVCISVLAGIVPAIKACLLKPSATFRSAGG